MQNKTIDLQEIKTKLVDKLRPSGWTDKLKGFILSSDFDKIIDYLYQQRESGKRFTPPLRTMFSAFEKCSYQDLKVVIIGQDPYPYLGISDGMAFSCSNTMVAQSSLQYILKSIYQTTYLDAVSKEDLTENIAIEIPDNNPDLSRWAEQGVLLLNTALSVEIDNPGTHQNIWKPFIAYLLDTLNSINSGIVFIFMGRKAQELEELIGEHHYKLFTSHPASAAHNNQVFWDCKDIWNETNKILKGLNNEGIKW